MAIYEWCWKVKELDRVRSVNHQHVNLQVSVNDINVREMDRLVEYIQ
jgi:hypothetical protein